MAVLAFKAVYTLEVTRRENDRRVLALYTEYAVETLWGLDVVSPAPG